MIQFNMNSVRCNGRCLREAEAREGRVCAALLRVESALVLARSSLRRMTAILESYDCIQLMLDQQMADDANRVM